MKNVTIASLCPYVRTKHLVSFNLVVLDFSKKKTFCLFLFCSYTFRKKFKIDQTGWSSSGLTGRRSVLNRPTQKYTNCIFLISSPRMSSGDSFSNRLLDKDLKCTHHMLNMWTNSMGFINNFYNPVETFF